MEEYEVLSVDRSPGETVEEVEDEAETPEPQDHEAQPDQGGGHV